MKAVFIMWKVIEEKKNDNHIINYLHNERYKYFSS